MRRIVRTKRVPACLALAVFIAGGLAGISLQAQTQSDKTQDEKNKVSLKDTKADIKAFSKRMDSAADDLDRTEAVVDLATLYLTIVGDHRFGQSERLQGHRGRIAARLQKHNKQLQRQQHKSQLASRKQSRQKERGNDDSQQVTDNLDLVTTAANESRFNSLRSAVVDPHWKLLSQLGGGVGPSMYYGSGLDGTAGHFWRSRGHFAGEPNDNGFELVDLIEAILHPDFWQTSGGPGVAYYYRPLRILVVRATTTVHEDLERFLERLR